MAFLRSLTTSRRRHERAGFALYRRAVDAARAPYLYTALGAPDTFDGRFDLVGLHVILLIERLRTAPQPGPDLAQAVFDAMFGDMDVTLREVGVGDLSVGKKVRTMWEAVHGRATAYSGPLESGDTGALAAALVRNVWRGEATGEAAAALAHIALAQRDHLAAQPLNALAAGVVSFLPPEEALGA